ncbi:hypothetical protein IFM89_036529 [Coptis chinensis]|uniref:Uncharacterized protein n=1 Tax=Coptis chinensis TaxID=261450 RepID=A0A835H7I6_9MAGN|nr:hypothetical protein IFM89_036529 [Coptis chinensis]
MASKTKNTFERESNIGLEGEEEDEEDELFEINLEFVNEIPPPQCCKEGFSTKRKNVLLANCLLPISDVSSAVPTNCWRESTVRSASRCVMTIAPWSIYTINKGSPSLKAIYGKLNCAHTIPS